MPAPETVEPRVGSVYNYDGRRVRLLGVHMADPNVWHAQDVSQPESRCFIARHWLANNAPLELGPESTAVTPVAPTQATPRQQETPQPAAAPDPQPEAPAAPTCPACNATYTGASLSASSHNCARVSECRCLACRSVDTTSLRAPMPPQYPYLCTACTGRGKKVCRMCGRVFDGRSRAHSGVVCNACTPLQEQNVWEAMDAQARGNEIIVEVRSHRPFAVEIESYLMPAEARITDGSPGAHWSRATDGSIRPESGATRSVEFRSPPFRGDGGLAMLYTEVKKIREMGYRANKSCGLHVHVNALDMKEPEFVALNRFGTWIQNDMYKLVANSRSGNHFCKKLTDGPLDEDRYRWLNIKPSWSRHRTVEFRLHHGITRPERVVEWVKVCLLVVERGLRLGMSRTRPAGDLFVLLDMTDYQRRYWESVMKTFANREGVRLDNRPLSVGGEQVD